MRSFLAIPLIAGAVLLQAGSAAPAEIKILTAGAMKSVVLALQGGFEAASGHRLVVDNGTVGGLLKRIEAGEAFDMAIISPNAIDGLSKMAGWARAAASQWPRVASASPCEGKDWQQILTAKWDQFGDKLNGVYKPSASRIDVRTRSTWHRRF